MIEISYYDRNGKQRSVFVESDDTDGALAAGQCLSRDGNIAYVWDAWGTRIAVYKDGRVVATPKVTDRTL